MLSRKPTQQQWQPPPEPPVGPLQDQSQGYSDLYVSGVIIWCSGGRPHHWITSYRFTVDSVVDSTGKKLGGVSVDMFQPTAHFYHTNGGTNQFGSVRIQPRIATALHSMRAPVLLEFAFTRHVKVSELVGLILRNKLQYYQFHPQRSGCLFWQLTLIDAFRVAGWLPMHVPQQIMEEIKNKAAREGQAAIPFPPTQGTFYEPPTHGAY